MISLKINSYDPGEFKIKKNDKLLIRMHTSPILIEQKITIKGSDINHINHIFLIDNTTKHFKKITISIRKVSMLMNDQILGYCKLYTKNVNYSNTKEFIVNLSQSKQNKEYSKLINNGAFGLQIYYNNPIPSKRHRIGHQKTNENVCTDENQPLNGIFA